MVAVVADSSTTFSETDLLTGYNRLISISGEIIAKKLPVTKQVNQSASLTDSRPTLGPPSTTGEPSQQRLNGTFKPSPATSIAPAPSSSLSIPKTRANAFPPKPASVQKQPTLTPVSSSIDPIFLTKSSVLVKAEIYQKRQRLEKLLEEQVHKSQRQKAVDQDALPDFDVTEVLRKAQELVKPTKLQGPSRANVTASSSDSFDENTFYSSQMDESTTDEADESQKWRPTRICKFFFRGARCKYGNSCTFSHDPALKQKLESEAVDLDRNNADKQANPRQDAAPPNENLSLQNLHPKPPANRNIAENPNSQSAAERERQLRIARLEAELRSAKAEGAVIPAHSPRQQEKDDHEHQEESAYSPPGPDEFGRDVGLRQNGSRHAMPVLQRYPSTGGQPPIREYTRQDRNSPSPILNNVRVVTNHIKSPVAPQPSRVSPLAVAKLPQVSQVQRDYGENQRLSRMSNTGNMSSGQSPKVTSQPRSSRKRRRGRDSGEQIRNVFPRTDHNSPAVRVKEEPISPPPFNVADPVLRQHHFEKEAPQYLYVDTAAAERHDEQPVFYQSRPIERPSYVRPNNDGEPQTPLLRRIVSRNGQRYIANEEPELRRVVTAPRPVRAPMSPAPYHVQSSAPQTRATRAASQVYLSPTGQSAPTQYRSSVQPQHPTYVARDPSPSLPVRRLQQSPVERLPTTMAPPPKRIVVDQWGNRFLEATLPVERQTSVAPVAREADYGSRYEEVIPQSTGAMRQPQFVRVRDESQFVRRAPSPSLNGFFEIPTRGPVDESYEERPYVSRNDGSHAAKYSDGRTVVRYEEAPEQDGRIVRMRSVRPTENQGEEGRIPDERIIRMQSVRPIRHEFEAPREQMIRVQSVRPEQPRIIRLGERQEPGRQSSRQVSVHPDSGDLRQTSYTVDGRSKRQYAPQMPTRGYEQEFQDDGELYNGPGNGIRRVAQQV